MGVRVAGCDGGGESAMRVRYAGARESSMLTTWSIEMPSARTLFLKLPRVIPRIDAAFD